MTDSLREDVLLVEGHTFQLPVSRDLVLAKICLVCYESYPRVRTSANTLTRPTTPTADSWQDTRPHRRCSSATSSPNSTAEHVRKRKGRGVNSWHIIDTSDQSLARPTQSVRTWPRSTTIPRSLYSGKGRETMLGSIRPAELEHRSCCESYSDTMCFCEWASWWSGPRVK